jgi:hypothetical protein
MCGFCAQLSSDETCRSQFHFTDKRTVSAELFAVVPEHSAVPTGGTTQARDDQYKQQANERRKHSATGWLTWCYRVDNEADQDRPNDSALQAPAPHDAGSIGGSIRHFGEITGRELKLDLQGSFLMRPNDKIERRVLAPPQNEIARTDCREAASYAIQATAWPAASRNETSLIEAATSRDPSNQLLGPNTPLRSLQGKNK